MHFQALTGDSLWSVLSQSILYTLAETERRFGFYSSPADLYLSMRFPIGGLGGGARRRHGVAVVGEDAVVSVAEAVALPVAGSASLSIGLGLDGGVVVAAVNLVT